MACTAQEAAVNLHAALSSLLDDFKRLQKDADSAPLFEDEVLERVARQLFDNRPHADWEPSVAGIVPLDLAWEKINALGGCVGEYDDFGKGVNHAVEQALFIIEELGGVDPARKRSALASADGAAR